MLNMKSISMSQMWINLATSQACKQSRYSRRASSQMMSSSSFGPLLIKKKKETSINFSLQLWCILSSLPKMQFLSLLSCLKSYSSLFLLKVSRFNNLTLGFNNRHWTISHNNSNQSCKHNQLIQSLLSKQQHSMDFQPNLHSQDKITLTLLL